MFAIRSLFAPLDARFLVTLALTVFSGVYLTKTGVSPIYGTTMLGLGALAAWLLAARGAAPLSMWTQSFFTLLLAVPFSIYHLALQSNVGNIVNFILGPILATLIPMSGRGLSRKQLVAIARAFVLATFAVATIECAYRLTHPDLSFLQDASEHREDIEDIAFYAYKFNSLMYIDSNFVGLQLAVLFAFLFGLSRQKVHIPRSWFAYTLLLTVLTLSRASIFACVFLMCAAAYSRFAKGPVLKFLVAMAVMAGALGAYYVIQDDASFATKFDILHRFVTYFGRAGLPEVLFGVGVGHAVSVIGIGAHNLAVTYTLEVGLLLAVLVLGYWLYVAAVFPAIGYMVLVWLVNGFSLTTLAVPYMYASAALLMMLYWTDRLSVAQSSAGSAEDT